MSSLIEAWIDSDDPRPLLIRGARRVGKTTLIDDAGARRYGDHFVKLDFQSDMARMEAIFSGPTNDCDRIVRNIAEYLRKEIRREDSLLFFDEVQLCEKALNSLRFFSGSGWRVIASGSLLGVTTKRRRLPFPSGIRQADLHPLDFEEWLWASGEPSMASAIREHAESLDPYILHDEALSQFMRYLTVGGMPKAVSTWMDERSFARVKEVHEEIDHTYTADMTDPDNGISGIAAKRIWESLPRQLLRSSTKKFKYSEVMRGGRRTQLLEPLQWLAAAGMVTINDLTCDTCAPLAPYSDDEGSFFKVYVADTGIMFHKFRVDAQAFLDPTLKAMLSSDFRGALAENAVAQALASNDLHTFYWMPESSVGKGEVDFVLQTDLAQVIPVEVKSGRNVSARSLKRLIEEGNSPHAYRLSELNFSRSLVPGTACELRSMPLYAAFVLEGVR